METERLLGERWNRIQTAVALERPDRIPVVLEYSGFAASVTDTVMAEFLGSPTKTLETMIAAYEIVGDGDAVNYGSFWPYGLCYDFFAKVRVPGVDLADDDMWQVEEKELLTREDYDRIVTLGWPVFFERFMKERILDDVPADRLPPIWKFPDVRRAWGEYGVPVLSGGDVTTPIELLCGARSFFEFFIDLAEIPDVVEAAMEAIVPHLAAQTVQAAKRRGYPAVWVGGWRGAPCLLSPEMWQRFVWRYFSRVVYQVVDSGLIAILHLDSDWTRELGHFRELPGRRCIVALDGASDIVEAKRVLGDHSCIMGDVPATLLVRGTEDQVYQYCTKLVRELGPEGFILQSGCDIPPNAKLGNVKAMVAAARESPSARC